MKRFEIWEAILPSTSNSHVQSGYRPVVIVSNDMANVHSPVITVIPLTTQNKKPLPTHVQLMPQRGRSSIALCEQILTVDKACLKRCVGFVYDSYERRSIHRALCIQLGMAA